MMNLICWNLCSVFPSGVENCLQERCRDCQVVATSPPRNKFQHTDSTAPVSISGALPAVAEESMQLGRTQVTLKEHNRRMWPTLQWRQDFSCTVLSLDISFPSAHSVLKVSKRHFSPQLRSATSGCIPASVSSSSNSTQLQVLVDSGKGFVFSAKIP